MRLSGVLYSDCELDVYSVRAVRMHASAVRNYYRFYNGKADSRASRSGVSRAVSAVETVKPGVERSLVYTVCGIDEFDLNSAVHAMRSHAYEPALVDVSEGVVQQKTDASSYLVFVSDRAQLFWYIEPESDTLRHSHTVVLLAGVKECIGKRKFLHNKLGALLHFREDNELLGEVRKPCDLALYTGGPLTLSVFHLYDLRVGGNDSQGRFHLVSRVGDEALLLFVALDNGSESGI